jgi:hypothetical protein
MSGDVYMNGCVGEVRVTEMEELVEMVMRGEIGEMEMTGKMETRIRRDWL